MSTQKIRQKFLNYFRDNGHSVIASSPVIPHDDPTLLFNNAGMNQFKDVFLGDAVREYKRAATSQKCIRAGGKHNDLENVGHTKRHLTFFEMLGNFSFGDYFKEEAIRFAWEVSTNVFEFDPKKIWATVFREDDEAYELWTKYLPHDRIQRLNEDTNFWAMGDTGPCGPCSELLYDLGEGYGSALSPLYDTSGERYLEYWNLVFMQFNKTADGISRPLPKPSIDTGAGLERVVELSTHVRSVFETDILRNIIAGVENLIGKPYDPMHLQTAPSFQVIADHLRTLSFAIADGAQPSNVDRGYVLRKILRRAVRYGRSLGFESPFLAQVLPRLIDSMGEDYPELRQSQGRIAEVLTGEEESFFRTLRRGGNLLNQVMERSSSGQRVISGEDAFKLKDTYGLPLEEITLLAHDAEMAVDLEKYKLLDEEAKERSRRVHKTTHQVAGENVFAEFAANHAPNEFLGYQQSNSESTISGIVVNGQFVDTIEEGSEGCIILDKTAFYPEKGGQVGDTGTIEGRNAAFEVMDCQTPYPGTIIHKGKMKAGSLKIGDSVTGHVDDARRQRISNNHTATHLLHWALRKVLGEHVRQAGSVVEPDRLRFDFSHHKGLSKAEIREIENLVNARIRENRSVEIYEIAYEDVQKRKDIIQFFDEKYGARVRVIDIDFSKELCGGIHTSRLGTIGLFRISKEGSIAAGVRRIEAVTGLEAEALVQHTEDRIEHLSELLKTQPQKLQERIEKLLEENNALSHQIKEMQKIQMDSLLSELMAKKVTINNISTLIEEVHIGPKEIKEFAEKAINALSSGITVLAAKHEDKCQVLACVSSDLIDKGIHANAIIKELSSIIQGGGGGKSHFAQAGGTAPEKIPEAIAKAKELVGRFPNS